MTVILQSITGDEQRSALLTWPRRSIVMSGFPTNAGDLNYLKRILFKNLHLTFGIPFWQDKTTLVSEAAINQNILNVGSTQYRNFEVGSLCILLVSRSSYAVRTIASIDSNTQITLSVNLSATWPAGTPIYPILKAKINPQQEIDLNDPSMGKINIIATEDFDDGITRHIPDISGFPIYPDIPIFNFKPRYGQLKQILYHPYEYLAFLGKSYNESNWIETIISFEGEYFINGRDSIWKFLDFFDEQKGRWGFFWIPTWQKDMVITEPFNIEETVLTIDPISFPTYWDGTETARFIALRWPDDTMIYKEIIDNDVTTITLFDAIGKASNNPSEVVVSFLLMSRFDIDEIEINYLTREKATTKIRFHSIPMENPI